LEFQEYRARKIVNVHKHVDGPWFWGKYTAHPYVGCRSGCEFCYARGSRYLGRRDPDTFDTLIGVKINAVELLRKKLPGLAYETISVGDWQQPAESRYELSRRMLEVVLEHGFPLFIVERSPLLTRDLDLLVEINERAWVGVLFSISSMVGISMMPIFPFVGDDEKHLEDLIRATKDHGGRCVLAGGLTMDGVQAQRSLAAAYRLDSMLAVRWQELYNWEPGGKPSYGPSPDYNTRIGLLVRELCAKYGLLDRMPRYVPPGPLAINKRIAERLFLKTYDLELEQAKEYRIWAYRKAAWAVDEWPESIADLYEARGEAGLRELPGVGKSLAGKIAGWLGEGTTTD
jgi:DNA repair photolyase